MINCTSCGSLVVPGDRFCRRCGESLTDWLSATYTAGNPFQTLKTRWAIPWIILGLTLMLVVIAIALPESDTEPIDPTAFLVAISLFYAAVTVWIVWRVPRQGVDLRQLMGRLPANYNWFAMLGIWLITITLSVGSVIAIALIAPDYLPWLLDDQVIFSDSENAAYPILSIVSLVIVAPLFEEVFFRGILINRWGIKWGFNKAIIVSAALFGLAHYSLGIVGAFMFGMVASNFYIRTRTLVVPIAMHMLNNLLVTIVFFAFPMTAELDAPTAVEEVQSLASFVGLALLLLTVPILIWYLRKNWPRRDEMLPYEVPGDGPLLAQGAGPAED